MLTAGCVVVNKWVRSSGEDGSDMESSIIVGICCRLNKSNQMLSNELIYFDKLYKTARAETDLSQIP